MDEGEAYNKEWEKEVEGKESGECGVVDGESTSGSFD